MWCLFLPPFSPFAGGPGLRPWLPLHFPPDAGPVHPGRHRPSDRLLRQAQGRPHPAHGRGDTISLPLLPCRMHGTTDRPDASLSDTLIPTFVLFLGTIAGKPDPSNSCPRKHCYPSCSGMRFGVRVRVRVRARVALDSLPQRGRSGCKTIYSTVGT